MAGSKVSANTQAAITPMATILPSVRNGGASEKLRLRNPIAVVTLVIRIGEKLTRNASTTACC